MSVIESIKAELFDQTSLEGVTSAYADISGLRIQSLRKAFQQNTFFYEQITQLYHSVQISAATRKYYQNNLKGKPNLKPKTLHVAVTSNHRFYGSLNREIMERFILEGSSIHDDRLIVGLTGKEHITGRTDIPPYNILIFQTDMPPKVENDAFIRATLKYDRVFLYYPKFVNMLTQTVDRIDIAYSSKPTVSYQKPIDYIFEPELPKILDFFNEHVRTLLFNRVMLEAELARTATRLFIMDSAKREVQRSIKKTKGNLRIAKSALLNRRLLETFSSIQKQRQ